VWQRQLQQELCLYKNYSPTKIFEDNTSAIYLINQKGTPHKRVKFFEIDWSYVKESAELGEIAVDMFNPPCSAQTSLPSPSLSQSSSNTGTSSWVREMTLSKVFLVFLLHKKHLHTHIHTHTH